MKRREFLSAALKVLPAAALANSVAYNAFAETLAAANRRAPDLSEANILRFTAGLRPFRKNGIRIEREDRFGKTLIHNYGHGGGGITLSWGTAAEAVELVRGESRRLPVAVLGGGVVGLSTAHELRARGFPVTIYSEKWHPHITSSVAGGQWSPALVAVDENPEAQARYQRILEFSFKKYAAFAGPKYGVRMRDNLIADGSGDELLKIKFPELAEPVRMDKLPFANVTLGGALCRSWLIEPPIYLPALTRRLRFLGVRFRTASIDEASISRLHEPIVFNCMGLGAKKLVEDENLIPIRGRLIHLRPDPRMDYLLLTKGYLFSRSDVTVLGGTYDSDQDDLAYDEVQYAKILQTHREFFNPGVSGFSLPNFQGIPYQPVGG